MVRCDIRLILLAVIFLVCGLCITPGSAYPPLPQCYIFNGGFEDGGDLETYGEWFILSNQSQNGYSYVEITDDWYDPLGVGAHSGDYILYMNLTGGPMHMGEIWVRNFIPIADYIDEIDIRNFDTLEFYVYIDHELAGSPDVRYISVDVYDFDYVAYSNLMLSPMTFTEGWNKVSVDISKIYTFGQGLYVEIYFGCGYGGQYTIWLDDFCLKANASPSCVIINGGFESGDIDGWLYWAGLSDYTEGVRASDEYSRFGEYSAEIVVSGFTSASMYQYIDCCHDIATMDFSYRATGSGDGVSRLAVWYERESAHFEGGTTQPWQDASVLLYMDETFDGVWTDVTIDLENNQMCTFYHGKQPGRIIFYLEDYDSGATAWIDGVTITPEEYPVTVGNAIINGGFETGNNIGWCMYDETHGTGGGGDQTVDVRTPELPTVAYSGDYVARIHRYNPWWVSDGNALIAMMHQDISPETSATISGDSLMFYHNILVNEIYEEGFIDQEVWIFALGEDGDFSGDMEQFVSTGYTEVTDGWEREEIDISSITDRTYGIRVTFFTMTMDGEVEWLVDDVYIETEIPVTPCLDCPTQPPPIRKLDAKFVRSPALVQCPATVTFTDVSEGSILRAYGDYQTVEQPYTRIWDFGDGTVIQDGNAVVEHTYTTQGKYTVTLTIYNDTARSTSKIYNGVYVEGAVFPNPTTTFGAAAQTISNSNYNVTVYSLTLPTAYTGLFNMEETADAWFLFWGLVFAFIFMAIFIRAGDTSLVMLFALLVAGSVMAVIPSEFQLIGQGMLVVAIATVIYILIKGRFK
jgi:hypothetical protein